MKKRLTPIIIIGLFLLIIPMTAWATSGTCGDNMTWVLDDNGVLTIEGSGTMTNYDSCGPWGDSVTGVIISEGVTSIGNYAFHNCSRLTEITLPDGVTNIGAVAFENCSRLTEIILPDSLTSIGAYAFENCSSLTEITLPDSVTSIGIYAFIDCSSLESITIPDGVTSIGSRVFKNCSSLENITIPDDIISIGDETFKNCSSLTEITIPDNVTNIGYGSFDNCPAVLYATLDSNKAKALSRVGYSFRIAGTQYDLKYEYSNNEIIGMAITGCDKDVTSFVIPDGVTSIGYEAFENCSNLESITIPDGVTSIGERAFENCSSLKSITIPDDVTSISDYTFSDCRGLESITLPDGVTSIGNYAFENCSNLESITISDGATSIGDYAFSNCSSLENITIPDSVTSIYNGAFYNCSSLTGIKLPDGVLILGAYAFENCSSLESITIPDSVISIGNRTFACGNLRKAMFCQQDSTEFPYPSVIFGEKYPTIYCYEYSGVESWAVENGFQIVLLDYVEMNDICEVTLEGDFRLACGKSRRIRTNVFPQFAEVSWNSSDPSVVSVTDGIVYAHSPGTAVITATAGNGSASVTITVYKTAESFELNVEEEWLIAKESIQLSVTEIIPADAETELIWNSSDTSIATVDSNGLVTTKLPGDITISAVDQGTGIKKEALLHACYPVTAVELLSDSPEVSIGCDVQLTANVTMRTQNCVNHLVTFTSSDEDVATVDQNGVVHGIAYGHVIITATAASGKFASLELDVRDACYFDDDGVPQEHDWGVTTYEWNAENTTVTAVVVCVNNPTHIYTETVTVTGEVTKQPTCTEKGETTYTSAAFRYPAFTVQSKVLEDVDALGHEWVVEYDWDEEKMQVTAIRICGRNTEHCETKTGTITRELMIAPTEDEPGAIRFSAHFENTEFDTEKTVQIQALKDLDVLKLPEGLTEIEDGAFSGISADAVIVPEGCVKIGCEAFSDCLNLVYIFLPAGVECEDDAFSGSFHAVLDRK